MTRRRTQIEDDYTRFLEHAPGRGWTLIVPPIFCVAALFAAFADPAATRRIALGRLPGPLAVAAGLVVGIGIALVGTPFAPARRDLAPHGENAANLAVAILAALVVRITFSLGLQTLLARAGAVVAGVATALVEGGFFWYVTSWHVESPGIARGDVGLDVAHLLASFSGPIAYAALRGGTGSLAAATLANVTANLLAAY